MKRAITVTRDSPKEGSTHCALHSIRRGLILTKTFQSPPPLRRYSLYRPKSWFYASDSLASNRILPRSLQKNIPKVWLCTKSSGTTTTIQTTSQSKYSQSEEFKESKCLSLLVSSSLNKDVRSQGVNASRSIAKLKGILVLAAASYLVVAWIRIMVTLKYFKASPQTLHFGIPASR